MEAHREPLLLEAILSASNLGTGLTCIRRYSFADKGQFFTGLFAYTIGLERILKLIVVLDYFHQHQAPPTNDLLRTLGHDVDSLLDQARAINVRRSFGVDGSALQDALVVKAISLLSQFAKRSRYYNLDTITGSSTKAQFEPLAEWDVTIGAEILRRHHRLTRSRKRDLATGTIMKGAPGVVLAHSSDDGRPIRDTEALAVHAVWSETKQKFSVFYLHQIVEFCISVLEGLDYLFQTPLYVSEPFRTMSAVPRKMVLTRKIWRPYL